jgi:hypothetical protein
VRGAQLRGALDLVDEGDPIDVTIRGVAHRLAPGAPLALNPEDLGGR